MNGRAIEQQDLSDIILTAVFTVIFLFKQVKGGTTLEAVFSSIERL